MTSSATDKVKFERPPLIETERLRLRGHRVDDLAASAEMWRDPEVVRFIGGRAFTREEVWARMLRYSGMWVMTGRGFWAIEEKVTGRMVGEVGVMDAKRDMEPAFGDEPEIGWSLIPAAQGKGFASEAVTAALAWADGHVDQPVQVCIIDPDNAPSIRLAEKMGFRERLRTTYHGKDTIQFERPRHGRVSGHG
ncbi:MAG: GNAT family N-acetyltransferase [Hyphomonadaceae bacterium]|nr:GNAT family N-acetyltransferase [Hyphomonadaceae bacterium]